MTNTFCEHFEFPGLDSEGLLGEPPNGLSCLHSVFAVCDSYLGDQGFERFSPILVGVRVLHPVKLLLQLGARHRSNNSASNQATARTIMNKCTSVLHT